MKLDPARIASEAHVLVPSASHHAVGLLHAITRALATTRVGDLRWRETILWTWQLLPRPGVRCIAIGHRRLREWTVCIAARPHGAYLAVGWYLVARPSWRGDLWRLLRPRNSVRERETVGSELGVRERGQLADLSALSRDALRRAIAEIVEGTKPHSSNPRWSRLR